MMDEGVAGRLAAARARLAERDALTARQHTVWRQEQDRLARVRMLEESLAAEQKDVRCLEGANFTSLLARIQGTRDERLTRERADVARLELSLGAARNALEALRSDQAEIHRRLAALGDVDAELAEALRAKEAELRLAADPALERLGEIDALVADADALDKEVSEAEEAARCAASELRNVLSSLSSARNWGRFDMMGGGLFATYVKHGRLDDARGAAHSAQRALDRLAREIADVRGFPSERLVADVDGFSRFADYFFDGLLIDWIVQSRIVDSQTSTEAVLRKVESLGTRLGERRHELRRERQALLERRARRVEEA